MQITTWNLAQVIRQMREQFALPETLADLETDPPKEKWLTRLARAFGGRRSSKPAIPEPSK